MDSLYKLFSIGQPKIRTWIILNMFSISWKKYPTKDTRALEPENEVQQESCQFKKDDCLKYIECISRIIRAVNRSKAGPKIY